MQTHLRYWKYAQVYEILLNWMIYSRNLALKLSSEWWPSACWFFDISHSKPYTLFVHMMVLSRSKFYVNQTIQHCVTPKKLFSVSSSSAILNMQHFWFFIVLYCQLGPLFMLCYFVHSVSWLFLLGCHYQCKWLTGKTYSVLMGTLNSTYSVTYYCCCSISL